MKVIKLNAIDSTNSFLKEMAHSSSLENHTVLVTKEQTKGRGQMGTRWLSEANKNLLCSVFIRFESFSVAKQVLVNYAVSIAIVNVLNTYKIPKLAIKWPNDILSLNKKICGILVENVIQKNEIKYSVIGIGLNVNQINFPVNFNATSILKETNAEVNLDEFLIQLITELKTQTSYITNTSTNVLKKNYLKHLYKKNTPTMFKNSKGVLFMGKIIGVSSFGKLKIELENDSIEEFGIKEISFA
ncbi:MAG: BirA family biotin operon repressor/biotin-[acetyl-CoA-carboxylase] ligase [Polaribacter sp.]|jgi:BirA family biotin operon repressor/biotin-[acetyl-CoA-carboxylase] ligase